MALPAQGGWQPPAVNSEDTAIGRRRL